MSPAAALFRRELSLAWGRGGGPLLTLGFYAAAVTLLPLAQGPDPQRLAGLATGVAWVLLALATLLSLERLFERDFEDGALDLLALGTVPLEVTSFLKCLAQWLVAGAPLGLASPVAAIALGAEPRVALLAAVTALVGGLAFAFVGGAGAALSLATRRGGLLIALLVLPLLAPPVIFGGAALSAFAAGLPWTTGFILLSGYTLAVVALAPVAMAAACRNALS
ncbi:MAG: heme exporter protein CcmB [Phenylobacterium sp.]|nr:heme exporter protein CcmB [Phenylobacterium sp.]